MASSATDAGNTEKNVREKLIDTGDVDCIVSVGNNFFYTRSLPCHVWFLDKGKPKENKDKILMIDARNTFRVVTNTINDYSPGQLQNFSAVMESYRGDNRAISNGNEKHKENATELAIEISQEVNSLRQQCQKVLEDHKSVSLDFTSVVDELVVVTKVPNDLDFDQCKALVNVFENPVEKLEVHLEEYTIALGLDKKELSALNKKDKNTDENKAKKKQLDEHAKLLRSLVIVIKQHQQELKESLLNYKQQVIDWQFMLDNFPSNSYLDVEGFCKITARDEIKENDDSLNPGRYVGFKLIINKHFDYKQRVKEVNQSLENLNTQANLIISSLKDLQL